MQLSWTIEEEPEHLARDCDLAVIDGPNLAYRAFHAVPEHFEHNGHPTNALHGFGNMLLRFVDELRPKRLIVCWDAPGSRSSRTDMLSSYKGSRAGMPENLKVQWPHLKMLAQALGGICVEEPGYEADDLIGALACDAKKEGQQVVIVTGDKDMTQLIEDGHIWLARPVHGGNWKAIDEEGACDWLGVPPNKVADLLGLMGDKADDIPGVDGVGTKTACKLITEYGDLEGVLAAAVEEKIKGKCGERLREQADQARLSKELATLQLDAPHRLDLTVLPAHWELDEQQLAALVDQFAIKSIQARAQGLSLDIRPLF